MPTITPGKKRGRFDGLIPHTIRQTGWGHITSTAAPHLTTKTSPPRAQLSCEYQPFRPVAHRRKPREQTPRESECRSQKPPKFHRLAMETNSRSKTGDPIVHLGCPGSRKKIPSDGQHVLQAGTSPRLSLISRKGSRRVHGPITRRTFHSGSAGACR